MCAFNGARLLETAERSEEFAKAILVDIMEIEEFREGLRKRYSPLSLPEFTLAALPRLSPESATSLGVSGVAELYEYYLYRFEFFPEEVPAHLRHTTQ